MPVHYFPRCGPAHKTANIEVNDYAMHKAHPLNDCCTSF